MSDGQKAISAQKAVWRLREDLTLISASGSDVVDFLHRISTNSVLKLRDGESVETVLCSDKGRIVDTVHVYAQESEYRLVCSTLYRDKVLRHCMTYVVMDDAKFRPLQLHTTLISVEGDNSHQVIEELRAEVSNATSQTASALVQGQLHIVQRGSIMDPQYLVILETSQADNSSVLLEWFVRRVHRCSDAEWTEWCILHGRPSAPLELNEEHNPLEANLLHLVDFRKGCYIGQEVIARLDSYNKVKVRLVGLRSNTAMSAGAVINVDGLAQGTVCSTTISDLHGPIALGYIRTDFARTDQQIELVNAETSIAATVQELPFQH